MERSYCKNIQEISFQTSETYQVERVGSIFLSSLPLYCYHSFSAFESGGMSETERQRVLWQDFFFVIRNAFSISLLISSLPAAVCHRKYKWDEASCVYDLQSSSHLHTCVGLLSEVVKNVLNAMFWYDERNIKCITARRCPFIVATYAAPPCQVVIVSLQNLTEASGVLIFSPKGTIWDYVSMKVLNACSERCRPPVCEENISRSLSHLHLYLLR